ncbi:hypothetical protein NL676_013698 [Syzygium grande]|nr:hypothetical protein NL676_013698 [Syzygium grande]
MAVTISALNLAESRMLVGLTARRSLSSPVRVSMSVSSFPSALRISCEAKRLHNSAMLAIGLFSGCI